MVGPDGPHSLSRAGAAMPALLSRLPIVGVSLRPIRTTTQNHGLRVPHIMPRRGAESCVPGIVGIPFGRESVDSVLLMIRVNKRWICNGQAHRTVRRKPLNYLLLWPFQALLTQLTFRLMFTL